MNKIKISIIIPAHKPNPIFLKRLLKYLKKINQKILKY